MGRPLRVAAGGDVYHVLNRANARLRVFHKDGDYVAFERVLAEALDHVPGMRLLSYCLMPNHWHLLVWPRADGELSDFGHYLTLTHTQRWHAHYHHAGTGHLYQGRFKSFPIEADNHFLSVCRYVERNALRSRPIERAEAWRWDRERGTVCAKKLGKGECDVRSITETFRWNSAGSQSRLVELGKQPEAEKRRME